MAPTEVGDMAVASCWSWVGHSEANARLIAAAPDLLAELRQIADVLHTKVEAGSVKGEEVFHVVASIDRAIAKATGSDGAI